MVARFHCLLGACQTCCVCQTRVHVKYDKRGVSKIMETIEDHIDEVHFLEAHESDAKGLLLKKSMMKYRIQKRCWGHYLAGNNMHLRQLLTYLLNIVEYRVIFQ